MHRRSLFALAPTLGAAALLPGTVGATGFPRSVNHQRGVALDGYDTVAWFTQSRPLRGRADFAATHAGVSWRFASAAHLAAFREDPARYTPRYGGYCAFGVARGYKVDIDPEAWHIEAGRLYLNYDRGVQRQWQRDIPGHIARADANWPRLADA
ncbi:YHS domain-containing (seleno)protein [Falsiroseomonas selenitidurans]|uniref:YHS domain protein n=1 Tax=Falsiroseomonas selenitidurans TaxID=2716335 RepID=A0ABX1DY26_9PROT|nr:YHS domain-containing (seleno)protein [Falsiroseomonas selenitidurans]NKC29819.1 YHS domain protein [Falsiroseomonas selenitidurans]